MAQDKGKICVYYDGACPKCVKDRQRYEKLAGKAKNDVCWLDITGQEDKLYGLGIDPVKALTELHVKDDNNRIFSEMDAYILLLSKVPVLKPVAWLIALPLIKPMLASLYHYLVNRRLYLSGRL